MIGKVQVTSSPCVYLVDIYWNSQKKQWSMRCHKRKQVFGYYSIVALKNCKCHVSHKGRERVRQQKRKYVHAWITGEILDKVEDIKEYGILYYNPYIDIGFTDRERNIRVFYAYKMIFLPDGTVKYSRGMK